MSDDAITPPAPPTPRSRRPLRTAQERRIQRRRWVTYGVFGVSCVLMVNALVGDTGYLATLRAQRDHDALIASLVQIRQENQDLRERARLLREDPAALEDAARRELGFTRPGEVLVIVTEPPRPASSR
jgi:cell division protein FtsB